MNSSGAAIKQESVKTEPVSNGEAGSDGKTTEVGHDSTKPLNGSSEAADAKSGNQSTNSPLNWLADLALSKEKRPNAQAKSKNGSATAGIKEEPADGQILNGSDGDSEPVDEEDDEGGEHFSTLRELLIRPAPKTSSKNPDQVAPTAKRQRIETLEDVISCVIEHGVDRESSPDTNTNNTQNAQKQKENSTSNNGETDEVPVANVELKHFIRKVDVYRTIRRRDPLPVRIMVGTESLKLYPDIPHSWLCNGKLLRLHDPCNPSNYKIFQVSELIRVAMSSRYDGLFLQDQWKRGQPVLVSGLTPLLDKSLWHPDSFSKDFGDEKNDLINCLTNNLVPYQPMKKFWDGFERLTKRLKDEKGQPMLLKLKVSW